MHLHFELHTFLFLLWTLPYLIIHFSKKEKFFGISKKIAAIIGILSVIVCLGDLALHNLFHHH